jgi:hypothetical protein
MSFRRKTNLEVSKNGDKNSGMLVYFGSFVDRNFICKPLNVYRCCILRYEILGIHGGEYLV